MPKTVGIFCAGQNGDILTISSVIKYRNELWGEGNKIIWFIDDNNRDLLKYQDVELRTFPRGFGYPKMVEEENVKLIAEGKEPIWRDWQSLVNEHNHLNIEKAKGDSMLEGIDMGFFPAPHQQTMSQRHGQLYNNISKNVFGVPFEWEWHPVINFSEEEKEKVNYFLEGMPQGKKICLETFVGSGQSILSDQMIRNTMKMCKEQLGDCNFIFVSHKYLNGNETFPEDLVNHNDVFFASHFSVRQCGYLVGKSDLLISVSSGISVASCCWENKESKFKTIQFCGSRQCSTAALAIGEYHLITHDEKPFHVAENEYYERLSQILNTIK